MRESSQKEKVDNEDPGPPGEHVEVERAWLVGRGSSRAPVASGSSFAGAEEVQERRREYDNYPGEEAGAHVRRGERRDAERKISHREEHNGAGHQVGNSWEIHRDRVWEGDQGHRERGGYQGQWEWGGYHDQRSRWGNQDNRVGHDQTIWGRDTSNERTSRFWEHGREMKVHGSFHEGSNSWNRHKDNYNSSNSRGSGQMWNRSGTNQWQRGAQKSGWGGANSRGAKEDGWGRADSTVHHNERWEESNPRENQWEIRGDQNGSWGNQRNGHQRWQQPEATRVSSGHGWTRDGEGGSRQGSSWDDGQQRRAFLDRQAHLERSALIVEKSSHAGERQDRPRQRKKFIQSPGGAFA